MNPSPPTLGTGGSDRPSKTRLKRVAHELQQLGVALAALPDERLAVLSLPDTLLLAIQEFKRTRSHEGRRRQMQFIGRLMRRIDPVPTREALTVLQRSRATGSND